MRPVQLGAQVAPEAPRRLRIGSGPHLGVQREDATLPVEQDELVHVTGLYAVGA